MANYTSFFPIRLSKVFDDLAESAGYRWWVTKHKVFRFKSSIPVKETDFYIDLESQQAQNGVLSLSFFKKFGDYRNVQIISGSGVYAEVKNAAELDRMKGLYGSGEYGSIDKNNYITEYNDAVLAASNILSSYAMEPFNVVLTTNRQGLELYNAIYIKGKQYGLEAYSKFIITEIDSSYNGKCFISKITAKRSDVTNIRPVDSWADSFGKIIN